MAYLVERGVDPRSILLLTFTRKAAQEMMERASRILDARCEMVAGGTFHSFANLTLRRYGSLLATRPLLPLPTEATPKIWSTWSAPSWASTRTKPGFPRSGRS